VSYQNKKGAGYYNRPLTRLVRTVDDSNAYASKEYVFTADAVYYGHVEQTGSEEVELNGRLETKLSAEITLRGWVAISAVDRLLDNQFGDTFIITSVARGNDEMICKGYRL
jgi:hypothetical protein